jgi:hypothetical protein
MVNGEPMDVAYEEIKKLVKIAASGADQLDRVAACIFTSRLPLHIHEQVLLQCGKDMVPSAVVTSAKRLMSANSNAVTCVASTGGMARLARRIGLEMEQTPRQGFLPTMILCFAGLER